MPAVSRKSTKSPAFQVYVKEWRSSRSVARMSWSQRGMYWEMLLEQWDSDDHSLPDSVEAVADLLGGRLSEWRTNWPILIKKFPTVAPGRVANARLEQEREKQSKWQKRARKGGSARASRLLSSKHKQAVSSHEAVHCVSVSDCVSVCDPVSDCVSASVEKEPPAQRGATPHSRPTNLIHGGDQRRHGSHAWCDHARGLCVPYSLHDDLKKRGMKSEADMKAWYQATITSLGDLAVGDDLFDFWRNAFAAWVGTVTAKPSQKRETYVEANMRGFREDLAALDAHHETKLLERES